MKNLPAEQECRFDPWVEKILWRRKWQPIPVFLPGKSHGQRNLVGYSPWGHRRVRHDVATKQSKREGNGKSVRNIHDLSENRGVV